HILSLPHCRNSLRPTRHPAPAPLSLHDALPILLEDAPTPLGLVDADLRGPLEQIVSRAMARDRDRRYQSAAALAADLRAFVEGRSEEHTSELQSRFDLVCRLLLEKKNE